MGSLDINDLTKVYNDNGNEIVAVDDVNLTIEDGEFLVLVGPSGCGKSTTLRCIAGLERVSSGELLLNGEPITRKRPKERDMAMVFQNYALYPHKSVRGNIGFGLKVSSELSSDEIDDRVEEVAEMLSISDLLDKQPSDLSGGQQQRVALGRAIVRDPEVFLMDEPLSNLDAKLRTQMRTELQQLQHDLDVTTIYVTHDQTEAMTMGDRIAILNNGRLQQLGPPLECYHEPANQFVAGFIGSPSMNFLSVERVGSSLVHDSFEYELSDELVDELRDESEDLVLGVRPEDIRLAEDETIKNAIPAEVKVVEPMGEVSYVYLTIGDQTYTASLSGETIVESGDILHVVFPESRIHLFDARTGDAIHHRELADTEQIADEDLAVSSS